MKTITDNFRIITNGSKECMIEFHNGLNIVNSVILEDCVTFDIYKTIAGLSYVIIDNEDSNPLNLIKMVCNNSLDMIESKDDKGKYKYYGKIFIDRSIGQSMRLKFINKLIDHHMCDEDLNIIEYYRAIIIFKNCRYKFYLENKRENTDEIPFYDHIGYKLLPLSEYSENIDKMIYNDQYITTTKASLFKSQVEIINKIKEIPEKMINNIQTINIIPISNYSWI